MRAAYVGSQSRHLVESLELNPSVYSPGSTLSTDARRAFQPFGSISQASQDINSGFNSLQLTAQKRYSKGLTVLASYTWSKSIDDLPYGQGITGVSAGSNSPIPWNFPGRHQFDRGPSEFDHQHRLVGSYVWALPTLTGANGLVRAFAGGWQLNGIVTLQSGGPLTILAGKGPGRYWTRLRPRELSWRQSLRDGRMRRDGHLRQLPGSERVCCSGRGHLRERWQRCSEGSEPYELGYRNLQGIPVEE